MQPQHSWLSPALLPWKAWARRWLRGRQRMRHGAMRSDCPAPFDFVSCSIVQALLAICTCSSGSCAFRHAFFLCGAFRSRF